jgi:hypothetical protein
VRRVVSVFLRCEQIPGVPKPRGSLYGLVNLLSVIANPWASPVKVRLANSILDLEIANDALVCPIAKILIETLGGWVAGRVGIYILAEKSHATIAHQEVGAPSCTLPHCFSRVTATFIWYAV